MSIFDKSTQLSLKLTLTCYDALTMKYDTNEVTELQNAKITLLDADFSWPSDNSSEKVLQKENENLDKKETKT